VGEKLSIITPKAQTTRHRILGIVNGEDYQIVFSDTPGMIKPHYRLQEAMMGQVESAFQDADVLLYVVEAGEKTDQPEVTDKIRKRDIPVVVVVNKIDTSDQPAVTAKIETWQEIFPGATVIPVSALLGVNVVSVMEEILKLLPEAPPYYDKDELTDKTVRFFVSEIIREKILLNYRKEVPYSVEVVVDTFKESDKIIHIMAFIHVARESQKMIIIGKDGHAIKRTGTMARKDLEAWLGKKIFLELSVKITKDWRDDGQQLQRFGYEA
jgi:GTP-binding protein Era